MLGPRNEVEFATEEAWSLLARFCGTRRQRLPEPVASWLRREPGSGELTLEDAIAGWSFAGSARRCSSSTRRTRWAARLTRREREILTLVRTGMSNAEIAAALSLSRGTVRRHLQDVYAKLGVHSRTAAIARTE